MVILAANENAESQIQFAAICFAEVMSTEITHDTGRVTLGHSRGLQSPQYVETLVTRARQAAEVLGADRTQQIINAELAKRRAVKVHLPSLDVINSDAIPETATLDQICEKIKTNTERHYAPGARGYATQSDSARAKAETATANGTQEPTVAVLTR